MADDAGGALPHPRLVLIDFRYHIVSITAVFLALGIGVAVGATVLDQVSVDALRNQLNELSSDLDARRAEITDLRADVRRTQGVVRDLAPRVMEGRLAGRRVLFVDAGQSERWADVARRAFLDAGAEDVGTLTLTPRWDVTGAAEALGETWAAAGLLEPTEPEVAGFAAALGELMLAPGGDGLVTALEDAGYVQTSGDGWPPPATDVVMFTSGGSEDARREWTATLAAAVAGGTPTVVSGASTEDGGAIGPLRGRRGLPGRLATFDSGELDETGIGSVLALAGAIDGRGGHYGTASGLSYLPPA